MRSGLEHYFPVNDAVSWKPLFLLSYIALASLGTGDGERGQAAKYWKWGLLLVGLEKWQEDITMKKKGMKRSLGIPMNA